MRPADPFALHGRSMALLTRTLTLGQTLKAADDPAGEKEVGIHKNASNRCMNY
jgi:hypothetical protein